MGFRVGKNLIVIRNRSMSRLPIWVLLLSFLPLMAGVVVVLAIAAAVSLLTAGLGPVGVALALPAGALVGAIAYKALVRCLAKMADSPLRPRPGETP